MSKVCVVCGIGPGNGEAFARRFAAEGYQVALLSRRTDLSEPLAQELGGKAYACDVTDKARVQEVFKAIEAELGPVNVLIYNAGSGTWGNIEELDADVFERAWRVNTLGAFMASQAVIPSMVERGDGAIVVVGATASLRGKPFTTAFAPAKAAQRSLAQAMARHLGPKGVHVALMILDGRVSEPQTDAKIESMDPASIAKAAHYLVEQDRSAWTFELDLRPHTENW
ncbi:MAG: SDR family NAD(P)-dependent oxidoreductase [Myxococcota bacterium]